MNYVNHLDLRLKLNPCLCGKAEGLLLNFKRCLNNCLIRLKRCICVVKDLRSFIQDVEEKAPGNLLRVHEEVSPNLEICNFLKKLERENKFPIVIFERIKGFNFPIVANLFASRRSMALALETTEENLAEEYSRREEKLLEPELVEYGPVKEVKLTEEEVDLTKLPIVTHNRGDGGPYITSGVTVAKDPDTGKVNIGMYRHQLFSKNELGILINPGKDLHYIYMKMEEESKPLEVAIVIGMHPAFHIASQTLKSCLSGTDEYMVAGGLLGEPLRVVKCETINLEVPSNAEFVLEGEILPKVRRKEGPFGEYTGYYGKVTEQPIIKIKAVTHRKDALYHDLMAGYSEHRLLASVPREGHLLRELRKVVPTVKKVHIPPSGACYHAYISLRKVNEGDPKKIALVALGMEQFLKHVVIVDDDIDIFNEREVLWAIATRMRADKDLILIPGIRSTPLDPTSYDISRISKGAMVTKVVVDATIPLGVPFPKRIETL